jgi:uncharacterized coiled-coil DUF342 family protein
MSILQPYNVMLVLLICLLWLSIYCLHLHYKRNMWRDECAARDRQIAHMHDEWHALNEEMRQTLEERDEWRRKTHDAIEVIIRKRATIHILRISCQEARNKLRNFCSGPSKMMDVIDKLERDFKVDSKSN